MTDPRFRNPLDYYRASFQFWLFLCLFTNASWVVFVTSYLANVWIAQQP